MNGGATSYRISPTPSPPPRGAARGGDELDPRRLQRRDDLGQHVAARRRDRVAGSLGALHRAPRRRGASSSVRLFGLIAGSGGRVRGKCGAPKPLMGLFVPGRLPAHLQRGQLGRGADRGCHRGPLRARRRRVSGDPAQRQPSDYG
jgi:hypothetical protein